MCWASRCLSCIFAEPRTGIAPRENKAEIEVKILRLIFEGHEDEAEQVDISADRANSGNGIDECVSRSLFGQVS